MTTPPSCATRALHHGISLLPRRPRSQSFPQRICRRPPRPEPRGVIWLQAPPTQDTCAPSSVEQRPKRLPITTQSTNQSGVNGKLNSSMQRQTIDDHFQPPPISGMDPDEVQLPDEHVGRDTTSRFAAYSCGCAFQSVSSSAQNPRSCARCAVMAKKSQVDGHTGRNARLGEGAFADDAKG